MATAAPAVSPALPAPSRAVFVSLSAALLGQFSSGLGAQMVSTALVDLQGTLGVSADEASWISTAYSMGEILMIPLAGMFIQAFGMRRFMIALCVGFMLTALASTLVTSLPLEITLRAMQGLLGGGFGVAAFGMTFRVFGGRNLPFGLMLLTFVQTVPASLGAVLAGWLTSFDGGWTMVYWVEIGLTLVVMIEVMLSIDQQCFDKCPILRTDWAGYGFLAGGLALLIMALSQGPRRFWLDNAMIGWTFVAAAVLICGFVLVEYGRPNPPKNRIIDFSLLRRRSFAGAIVLNMLFRMALLNTSYLAPQFLGQFQGYRALETGNVLVTVALVQLVAFPATYWMMRHIALRVPIFIGLVLFALGAAVTSQATTMSSADQFALAEVLLGTAPALFVVPLLVIGTRDVKPSDGQSASTFFNGSRSIGQLLGTAILATMIRDREQFHSAVLTERMASAATRIDALRGTFGHVIADFGRASAAATASMAAQVRQQAFVLAYNDVFVFMALVLGASAVLTLLLPPHAPIKRRAP